ncbi:hypothetical protein CR513_49079, partial [Mucuna pruriens]
MFQKLRLPTSNLEECLGTLFGFAEEQVEIRGMVEIETIFGVGASARSLPITYIVVNIWASYNMIIGPPALNKLRAVVSTLHLCMKYPVGKGVGFIKADKNIACRMQKTRIGPALDGQLEERLIHFLMENHGVFAWTPTDMPWIDLDFLCHRLSITRNTLQLTL